jgi:hypothetical protein
VGSVTTTGSGEDRQKRLRELTALIWQTLNDYERTSGAKVYWIEHFAAGLVIHHTPKDAPPPEDSPPL